MPKRKITSGKSKTKRAAKAIRKAARKTLSKILDHHAFSDMVPMASEQDFQSLLDDIALNGQRDPIILYQGKILDGRNRYRACLKLNRKPVFEIFKGTDARAISMVYSRANRRNMNESQKAASAVNFLPHFESLAKARMEAGGAEPVPEGQKGDSRDFAGNLFGVSGRYVSDAKWLRDNDEKLFRRVFDGELPISQAKRELKREHKTKLLKEKTREARESIKNLKDAFWLATGDAPKILRTTAEKSPGTVKLIATDPPYNQGIDYGMGIQHDMRPDKQFLAWCESWLKPCYDLLADDGSIMVMMTARYQAGIELILQKLGMHRRNVIAWVENFGNYNEHNFTECWRPIIYYTKDLDEFTWHGDQILIPSDRQTKYSDKRASKGGKVPGNVWAEFPRLVDNAKERNPGFPTQLPEALCERIVRVASNPGDLILDPFNGSGTFGAAAIRHRRRYGGIDEIANNIIFTQARLTRVLAELEGKDD